MKQEPIRIKGNYYLLWQFDTLEDMEQYINYNDYEVSYKCKGEEIKKELKLDKDDFITFMCNLNQAGYYWDSPSKIENFNPKLTLIFDI